MLPKVTHITTLNRVQQLLNHTALVNNSITLLVFLPETLIIAIPEIPGPVDRA